MLAATIERYLRRDLELAGIFRLTDSDPAIGQVSGSNEPLDLGTWTGRGETPIAYTTVDVQQTRIQLDFRLLNPSENEPEELPTLAVTLGEDEVEDKVHEFANAIVWYFSGYSGPFGTDVAFVAETQPGSREIYRLTVGGDHLTPLTRDNSINVLPDLRDNALVYTTYLQGQPELAILDDSGIPRIISYRSGLNIGGTLAPDGRSVAVTLTMDGQAEIYLVSPDDGSIVARLTEDPGEDFEPAWSPEGNRIAFVSDRSGRPQIYVMNRDGSELNQVTDSDLNNTSPDWSPDERLIAFTGRDADGQSDLFTVDVGTLYVQRLTQGQGNNEEPSWSPNGQYFVFSSDREVGQARLYISTADGVYQALLIPKGIGYHTPDWGQ